jgi:DNA-directed RNA polymerase specialized sigma subunit
VLRYFNDRSEAEVARLLGITMLRVTRTNTIPPDPYTSR